MSKKDVDPMIGKPIPIGKRALIQRINRKLAEEQKMLRSMRGKFSTPKFGEYAVVDLQRECIGEHHVDLGKMARKLGVLKPWETYP